MNDIVGFGPDSGAEGWSASAVDGGGLGSVGKAPGSESVSALALISLWEAARFSMAIALVRATEPCLVRRDVLLVIVDDPTADDGGVCIMMRSTAME